MLTGGYQIIDFEGKELQANGAGVKVEGIFDKIANSDNKMLVASGINIAPEGVRNDMAVHFEHTGTAVGYQALLYIENLSTGKFGTYVNVAEDDIVTITTVNFSSGGGETPKSFTISIKNVEGGFYTPVRIYNRLALFMLGANSYDGQHYNYNGNCNVKDNPEEFGMSAVNMSFQCPQSAVASGKPVAVNYKVNGSIRETWQLSAEGYKYFDQDFILDPEEIGDNATVELDYITE